MPAPVDPKLPSKSRHQPCYQPFGGNKENYVRIEELALRQRAATLEDAVTRGDELTNRLSFGHALEYVRCGDTSANAAGGEVVRMRPHHVVE
jgi:hypothetical protein